MHFCNQEKNPHKYCHLEIIYCFTMTQKRNNIKRIFFTNPHNFLPQLHYSNLSDTTGLLKLTLTKSINFILLPFLMIETLVLSQGFKLLFSKEEFPNFKKNPPFP